MSQQPRCLVIDTQPLLRLGVRHLLADSFEIEEVPSRGEALELVRDIGDFDVAVVDMRSPVGNDGDQLTGTATIRALRRAEPALGIVAFAEQPERHLASEAIAAGAAAFVSKRTPAPELRRAVEAALDQEEFVDPDVPPKGTHGKLTKRQRQLLQRLADGESAAIAARALGLGEETVKTHTKNILMRLGARNRVHAVAIALRESLID